MAEKNLFPDWDKEKPQESIDAIYLWTVQTATNSIEWYDIKKKTRKIWSKTLRALSIIFATVNLGRAFVYASYNIELTHQGLRAFS